MVKLARAQEAAEAFEKEVKTEKPKTTYKSPMIASTGSTQLDLAIYGGRIRGGGIPGGIVIEIFGPTGIGKTAIAAEICGSVQANGGEAFFQDPETRLDKEYSEIYGVNLPEGMYRRTHLVPEIFDHFRLEWDPPKDKLNAYVIDSLAALTTKLEMGPKGDKMGMRRAKELSEGLRKSSIVLAEGNRLMVCTNQLREGESGKFTPGGKGVGYWSSVRIEIKYINQYTKGIVNKSPNVIETIKVGDKNREVEKIMGIRVLATVIKNSKDDPYRFAPISIIFGYGIDNIRDNLQYLKDILGESTFVCPDGLSFQSLKDAIGHVEKNNLEEELRERVIDLWEDVEAAFKDATQRKKKKR